MLFFHVTYQTNNGLGSNMKYLYLLICKYSSAQWTRSGPGSEMTCFPSVILTWNWISCIWGAAAPCNWWEDKGEHKLTLCAIICAVLARNVAWLHCLSLWIFFFHEYMVAFSLAFHERGSRWVLLCLDWFCTFFS